MNIYVLRHGLAVEPNAVGFTRDADRPLTPEGERKLRKIGKAMKQLDLCFDLVLSSPYLRAHQTAEIIVNSLKMRKTLEFSDSLVPGGAPSKLVHELLERQPVPENILLVGHEPNLSELISLLISGDTDIAITMKKAGLCKLETESLRASQCASLEWLLTAKQLCLMA
jgi:phosphohistidine phosphatase